MFGYQAGMNGAFPGNAHALVYYLEMLLDRLDHLGPNHPLIKYIEDLIERLGGGEPDKFDGLQDLRPRNSDGHDNDGDGNRIVPLVSACRINRRPGRIAPPRKYPSAPITSVVMAVPQSKMMTGKSHSCAAATALATRSAPRFAASTREKSTPSAREASSQRIFFL